MVRYRQLIKPGDKGRDVKAVKDGLKRMKVKGSAKLSKDDKAGRSFVGCIKTVQKAHKLKADGIYGPATHAVVAPHFSLFDNWRYRTAKKRHTKTVTNPFPGGWIPNRLDMGFDGTFSGHIVAPFDGIVTYVTDYNASWRGGVIQIKAHKRPFGLPTDTLYFTEGCAPTVSAGTRVKMGQIIGKEARSGWGNPYGTTPDGSGQIEWGVAAPGIVGQYVNCYAIELGLGSWRARAMVLAFAVWAKHLGLKGPTSISAAGGA